MCRNHLLYCMIKPLTLVCVLIGSHLMLGCETALAQSTSTSLPFLSIEPDARASALGGSGVTMTEEGFGAYYNPASLGWKKKSSVGLSYSNWLAGLGTAYQYNRFAATKAFKQSALAVSVTYMNLGKQTATDASNNVIGTFTNYQAASGISYGRRMTKRLSFGLGLKHIYSSLGAGQSLEGRSIDPAWTYAGDVGLLWHTSTFTLLGRDGTIRFGSSLSHFGPGISYLNEGNRSPLPQTFRVGLGMTRNLGKSGDQRLSLSADALHILARSEPKLVGKDTVWASVSPLDALMKGWGSVERLQGDQWIQLSLMEQLGFAFGGEYQFKEVFALRGGYFMDDPNNGNRQFVTVGAGFKVYTFQIDFSYLHSMEAYHPMDGTMRMSLLLNFK
jgi:hypothetical protein